MKKTIWQPLVLGVVLGLLAGVTTAGGLSFLAPGIADNAVGLFMTLLLLAAALGGPLAGAIAPAVFVPIVILFGPPEMKETLTVPASFWSNLLSLAITAALVGFAYRWIFERVKMPARLLPWAGIVIIFYVISVPASIIPQYLSEGPTNEMFPAVWGAFRTYIPQAILDVFITSLVFVALPRSHVRPLWYVPKIAPEQKRGIPDKERPGALCG
jgi:hypothetical protein